MMRHCCPASVQESLDDAAPLVTSQLVSVLRRTYGAVRFIRRDHFNALLVKLGIQWVNVVGAITDHMLQLRPNHEKSNVVFTRVSDHPNRQHSF
jgi:hypothetical protein